MPVHASTVFADNATVAASPAATPTAASEAPAFAIYPKGASPHTSFNVTQKAGTSASYTVDLISTSSKAYGVFKGRTFVADAKIRPNGGLQSGDPTEAKTEPATWFDYPTDVVSLQPGTGIERTFNVSVPANARPGQYIAVLCLETADPLSIPGQPNFKQVLRSTIAFVINVPGKIDPAFSIKDVHVVSDETWSGIEATISNKGNILVAPSGTVALSDLSGKQLVSLDVQLGEYFAFRDGLLQVGIQGLVPNGRYLVTIDLHDAKTGASASIENQEVTVTTSAQIAAAAAPPVMFSTVTGELKPSAEKPQFLNVGATITNNGEPVQGAEVSILAYKDGKLVETYVLVSPLALPKGDTSVNSRYIPADGFSKDVWTFKLSV